MFSCQNTSKRGGGVNRGIQILNLKYPNPSVLKQICEFTSYLTVNLYRIENLLLSVLTIW